MNALVAPAQAMNFRARSLLAFVLEPTEPLAEWFAALDAWLARSPNFFASRPVILEMAALELNIAGDGPITRETAARRLDFTALHR